MWSQKGYVGFSIKWLTMHSTRPKTAARFSSGELGRSLKTEMSNRTYICIDCCTARRGEAAYGKAPTFKCSECGKPLWELSHKWRIPKKSDRKEWRQLKRIVEEQMPVRAERRRQRLDDLLGKIDWQLEVTDNQKPSERRTQQLKRLKAERTEAIQSYSEPIT